MTTTHETSNGSVTSTDQGAHLVQWQVRGTPVIWVSRASEYAVGRPVRGGVPICWPWFGPGRTGDLAPMHGFARITPWHLVQESAADGVVHLTWQLTAADVADAPGVEHFPQEFTARYSAVVDGDSATLSLTVRNEGVDDFDYEAALHTYLHVGDAQQIRITGLEGASYFDKVLQAPATQAGPLTLTGETDRVFSSTHTVEIHDPVLERRLVIEKSHSPTTVVWNPWVEKAAAMSDFGDEEWQQMLCVEAAAVGEQGVRLAAGAEHTLSTVVRVLPLDG